MQWGREGEGEREGDMGVGVRFQQSLPNPPTVCMSALKQQHMVERAVPTLFYLKKSIRIFISHTINSTVEERGDNMAPVIGTLNCFL